MSQTTRWLVLPDLQIPYHDERTIKAVEAYMRTQRFDGCIILGDFMDFNCISHWNDGKPGETEGMRLGEDYDIGNGVLDRWDAILRTKNPNCRMIYLEGNHDYRVMELLKRQPVLKGQIEVPYRLNLERRRIEWVPFWSEGKVFKIGKATFIHGKYTNQYHAAKHVARYGTNVFYGHLHDVQCYSLELLGDDKTIVGQSLGCLCLYDQPYSRGAPTRWQQAFGVFDFFPDGYFSYQVVRIFKHRFHVPGAGTFFYDPSIRDGRVLR